MRQDPGALMLFAAGMGTRMGALTKNIPKPLLQLAGRTLIDRALDIADAAGIARKVVNLHYLGAQIATHLAPRTDTALSWERDQILDTGGGLRAALPLLGPGPVFTLNPDAVWSGPNPLSQLQAAWDGARMDCLLLLLPLSAVKGRTGAADFVHHPDGRITRAALTGQHLYLGAQVIRTDRLADIPTSVFSLNQVWDHIIADRRAYGLLYSGNWCDVGTPQGLAEAAELLASDHV